MKSVESAGMLPAATSSLAAAIRKSKKFPKVKVPPNPSIVLAAKVEEAELEGEREEDRDEAPVLCHLRDPGEDQVGREDDEERRRSTSRRWCAPGC